MKYESNICIYKEKVKNSVQMDFRKSPANSVIRILLYSILFNQIIYVHHEMSYQIVLCLVSRCHIIWYGMLCYSTLSYAVTICDMK